MKQGKTNHSNYLLNQIEYKKKVNIYLKV